MIKKAKDLATHEKDTGSSEVQIALLTEKRDSLSDHVLAQMFAWPELFELLSDVDTDVFEKTEDKQIFAKWKEFISSGIPNEVQTNFEKELDQTLKQRYFDIRNQPLIEGYKENVKSDLKYCVARLEERYLKSYRMGMFHSGSTSETAFERKLADIDKKLRDKRKDLIV